MDAKAAASAANVVLIVVFMMFFVSVVLPLRSRPRFRSEAVAFANCCWGIQALAGAEIFQEIF
jgi:hypothetical protein